MATDIDISRNTVITRDTATRTQSGLEMFTAIKSMRNHRNHLGLNNMLITQTSLNMVVRATGAGRRTVHEKVLGPAQATV